MSISKKTPLFNLHQKLGAKMAPFAGYSMPIQYQGIIEEHLHCRSACGLFDVSHMGQCIVKIEANELEKILTTDLQKLKPYQVSYSLFTNDQGGILDDLMVTKEPELFYLVVNAACKENDFKIIETVAKDKITILKDAALIALQGPQTEAVLTKFSPDFKNLNFMQSCNLEIMGVKCHVSRSGYTGEDGFEISLPASESEKICSKLLEDKMVKPIGLGARNSLRLEAGLCLYGQDITEDTSPIEARINFAISKERRNKKDFKGHLRILNEIATGVSRKRVGLVCEGKLPVRTGAKVFYKQELIGEVTSGCYSPSLKTPIAMAYLKKEFTELGIVVQCQVRNQFVTAKITTLPFIPSKYKRNKK